MVFETFARKVKAAKPQVQVMAGILGACLLVWASVLITTGTQVSKINDRALGTCVAGGKMTGGTVTELPAGREIVCAMLCPARMAQKYTFNGTTCTLVGTTSLSTSSENIFRFFPSPDTLEDIATGKKAYASSIFSVNYNADKAVDTDERGQGRVFISGSSETNPWWQLDLGEPRTIHEIQIIPRTDSYPERFHDVEIRVGEVYVANSNLSSYTLFASYVGPYTIAQGRLSCASSGGVRGRFVSIQKMKLVASWIYLQIGDVNVFVLKEN